MKRSRRSILRKARQSGYERRPVTINGKELLVQGYEVHVLQALEHDIKRITVDMERMPEIRYPGRHWRRRYYPDALIETTTGRNILLEVKSPYTLKKGRVLAKAKAAFDFCGQYDNLEYMVAVYTPNKPIVWITSMSELHLQRKST